MTESKMAVPGDMTLAQDGEGNAKLHPYLATLVYPRGGRAEGARLFQRSRGLRAAAARITVKVPRGAKPPKRVPKRTAGTEHLHPEPRVECQLLHQPEHHSLDVIFVHGLYGSLGNTWRQGDWRQKYITSPQKIPLHNHSKPNTCNCRKNSLNNHISNENNPNDGNVTDLNEPEMSFTNINEKLSKKVIPEQNDLITEQFYNNTLMDQDVNYNTQGNFVRDLYNKENNCDITHNEKYEHNGYNGNNQNNDNDNNDYNEYSEVNDYNECKCSVQEKKCEVGCGCVCNDCYSDCWPKDWIKEDFPGARVISINYTSDPYLWRPLWIKENKRLNLYQRAEQMMEQLLEMGVGEKPIIWVGHSKGGLFIKQIYCEAYEAYMKINKYSKTNKETKQQNSQKIPQNTNELHNGITAENIDTIIGHFSHNNDENLHENEDCPKENNVIANNGNYTRNNDNDTENNDGLSENSNSDIRNNEDYINNNDKWPRNNENNTENNENDTRRINNSANNNSCVMDETVANSNIFEQINNDNSESNGVNDNLYNSRHENDNGEFEKHEGNKLENENQNEKLTSNIGDKLDRVASLYPWSRGFMFYSVPHRGSPLADIKTPVTARSVDLLEIAKDCPLVVSLQSRWLAATRGTAAAVRGVVESRRTLMSVLWLRIVSAESADAGIGTLSGVSVDHREICKPSSRSCLLYTELTELIRDALNCRCQ